MSLSIASHSIKKHHSSYSVVIGDKYFESNRLDNVLAQIPDSEIARMERFHAEHLENEDYSDIDRENDESIERHDD